MFYKRFYHNQGESVRLGASLRMSSRLMGRMNRLVRCEQSPWYIIRAGENQ